MGAIICNHIVIILAAIHVAMGELDEEELGTLSIPLGELANWRIGELSWELN